MKNNWIKPFIIGCIIGVFISLIASDFIEKRNTIKAENNEQIIKNDSSSTSLSMSAEIKIFKADSIISSVVSDIIIKSEKSGHGVDSARISESVYRLIDSLRASKNRE